MVLYRAHHNNAGLGGQKFLGGGAMSKKLMLGLFSWLRKAASPGGRREGDSEGPFEEVFYHCDACFGEIKARMTSDYSEITNDVLNLYLYHYRNFSLY